MASVSSLDKDLRRMRLEKYTVSSVNEVRNWIEFVLGEKLSSSDLLESLRDGVALCRLANLALPPPGLRFKKSAMPFVQMENISLFLKACQSPPINLPEHDMFLTVDLYEQKDPAQVLQCIGSFSRAAHIINPTAFPTAMGPPVKARPAGALSPQPTGNGRQRAPSNVSTASSTTSKPSLVPVRTGTSGSDLLSPVSPDPNRKVSTWTRKDQETVVSPAWNIAQYGYMGGASQGNLGIAFGGRRQITTAAPMVPSLQQKESIRKQKVEEEERQRREMEEETKRRQAERTAEEERIRLEEEHRWAEESKRARDAERKKQEEERKRWEEEEHQWKITEEKRKHEEAEAEKRIEEERRRVRSNTRPTSSSSVLTDHFLSHYGNDSPVPSTPPSVQAETPAGEIDYKSRVKELERELELARQREQEYERERQSRLGIRADDKSRTRSKSHTARPPSRQDSWSRGQREVLSTSKAAKVASGPSPLSGGSGSGAPASAVAAAANKSPRPLPNPANYSSPPRKPVVGTTPAMNTNRTDRFLSSNATPSTPAPHQTYAREFDASYEQDAEDRQHAQSQEKTKTGGWDSKSLLEREMERERERQKEWEARQEETAKAARMDGVDGIGGGIGGRWDVSQFSGYTGGDNLNRTDRGGIGSTRRQIVGTPQR